MAQHARRAGADRARATGRGSRARSPSSTPGAAARRGQGGERPRPRRRRLPGRRRSGGSRARAAGEQKFIVANGDEGDPGSYIDKYLMERNPALVLEGMALAGYAVGADHGFVLTPLGVPALEAGARGAPPRPRATPGCSARTSRGSGFSFDVTVLEGAGSYVVGEETALLACIEGLRGDRLRAPAVPGRARPVRDADGRQQHRDAREHPVHRRARAPTAYRDLSPGATAGHQARLLQRALRAPRRLRGPLRRRRCASCARTSPAACATAARIKALQIGGPLGGILPASLLDTPFDFDAARRRGLHGRPRRHRRLRRAHRHARARAPPAALRRPRELRQVLPLPDRPAARARDVRRPTQPVDRARLEELLEALELGSLCAHGGGMPAPIRSLLAHFPDELGLALMQVTIDGARSRWQPGTHACSRRSARLGGDVPTLCYDDAPGAVRRLPRVPRRRRRARRVRSRRAPRRAARACGSTPRTRPRAGSPRRSSSSCSPSCPSRPAPHTELADGRALGSERRTASRAGPASTHERRARRAPPLPRLPARAVHLLRALRARLRRGPGRIRADRHRARLQR